jgi:hypothetical protein
VCFIVRKTISELECVILTTLFLPVQKTPTPSHRHQPCPLVRSMVTGLPHLLPSCPLHAIASSQRSSSQVCLAPARYLFLPLLSPTSPKCVMVWVACLSLMHLATVPHPDLFWVWVSLLDIVLVAHRCISLKLDLLIEMYETCIMSTLLGT